MGWLVAERALDATPVNISFGKLQSLLAPVARYWWRAAAPPRHAADREQANDPTWSRISYDDWTHRKGVEPRKGTVELFGPDIALCMDGVQAHSAD